LKLKLSGISKFSTVLPTKTAIQVNKRLKNERIYDLGGEKKMYWALSPPESGRAPRRMNLRESLEMIIARFDVHKD
jgi:hypothetical protein